MDIILIEEISKKQGVSVKQIETVLNLLDEGNTVPFIARYRKEQTKGLDEEEIRAISKEYEYENNLKDRKEDVLRLIEEKGKLTEDLRKEILACKKLSEVEDLYRPYKEKKKTRATTAKKLGLEPLAKYIKSYPTESIEDEAMKYITDDVVSVEDAIQGAKDIIAEEVADNPKYRKFIKNNFWQSAFIECKVKKEDLDEQGVYKQYYEHSEPLKKVVPHRVLAMNRGEKEKILNVSVKEDSENILYFLKKDFIRKESLADKYLEDAITDGYKRLIKPSVERELRSELKEKAEEQAINVFSENLHSLLLQPPMKDKIVLGVDPAYRTGCKLSVLDVTGKVLEIGVIYPHQKYVGEKINPKRIEEAKQKVLSMVSKHKVDIIAIGNGTASRETETFIADLITSSSLNALYVIVNEAGASVYSASDNARKEFPEYEVEERSAVSIGRRLQDPLSELVKIDPKSIGVGQYQHDVSQKRLNEQLNFVVETAVNKVGVNINSASQELLQYISGLTKKASENIVKYRDEFGKYLSRKIIKKVPGLGPKSYEQSVGFLRIVDGKEPLDKTAIHPESYDIADKILDIIGISKELIGSKELINKIKEINRDELRSKLSVDEYTFNDILDSLVAPNRDPRDEYETPILKQGVMKLSDLTKGMELTGTVRNVVDFGAFVDCGVKEDGLVHISKLSNNFVKHPMDVVQVGQIVKVWVEDVDIDRGRLSLTMLDPTK